MAKRIHMSVNIKGFLRNFKGKHLNGMMTDNGVPLSGRECRNRLYRMLSEGKKLIRTCDESECPDFDEFENGCPGHEIPQEQMDSEFEKAKR